MPDAPRAKAAKPLIAWAAFVRGGYACTWTIRLTRTDCIKATVEDFRGRYTWPQLRKRGWSVAKISITPIKDTPDAE